MEFLRRITSSAEATWYAVDGSRSAPLSRYVVTTPWSREVCNSPEILGLDFNRRLQEGMTAALRTAPFRDLVASHPEERVCVVNFLRGGLNFELRRALHGAYGFNRHSSAFMSSQRYRQDGRWGVKEDMYRKLEIAQDAVLIMGDVVATGVTMEHGLHVIADHMAAIGSSARAIVFFTIGCHKAEKVLEDLDRRMRDLFPAYQETVLVYLEGKFRLVDSKTPLRIRIPGTDLVRWDALMTPEFELSQFQAPALPMERCVVYDAGSRAFDIPRYVDEVLEYWKQVAALARDGFELGEALEERWPGIAEMDPARFVEEAGERWQGVPQEELDAIQNAREKFWKDLRSAGCSSDALAALAAARQDTLEIAGGRKRL